MSALRLAASARQADGHVGARLAVDEGCCDGGQVRGWGAEQVPATVRALPVAVGLVFPGDADRVWTRLLELAADPDPRVRGDVIHAITDSTPTHRVPAVIQALGFRHNDPDAGIRRRSARPSPTTGGPGK